MYSFGLKRLIGAYDNIINEDCELKLNSRRKLIWTNSIVTTRLIRNNWFIAHENVGLASKES